MNETITNNKELNSYRKVMKSYEKKIKKLDDEMLVWLTDYIGSELEKRSQEYMILNMKRGQ